MWTFKPIFQTKIWGGNAILPYKGLEPSDEKIGESWELSAVPEAVSVVASGPDAGTTLTELIDRHGAELMGEHVYTKYGNQFPLLVKFLDSSEPLSVQVHPDDEKALEQGHLNGKTEMWYVLDTKEDADIAAGFKTKITPEEYKNLVEAGTFEDCLNFVKIKKGDTFFIPGRRVHALGAGALVAEIQQTSDVTYRIYDYNRKDDNGNTRELHTELALQTLNFDDSEDAMVDYNPVLNLPVELVNCKLFTTNLLHLDRELMRDYSECDSFVILILTEGSVEIKTADESMNINAGTTVLIPASTKGITIIPQGQATLLETYIR